MKDIIASSADLFTCLLHSFVEKRDTRDVAHCQELKNEKKRLLFPVSEQRQRSKAISLGKEFSLEE